MHRSCPVNNNSVISFDNKHISVYLYIYHIIKVGYNKKPLLTTANPAEMLKTDSSYRVRRFNCRATIPGNPVR